MSSETSDHDEAIGQFCGVTGADEERAKGLLEACDWNLELAINMHVDGTDDGSRTRPSGLSSSSAAGPSTSNADAPAVITIPDDSLEDIHDETKPPARRFSGSSRVPKAGGAFCDPDDVRPPIPPVRQVLVQNPTSYISDIRSRMVTARRPGPMPEVYDAFRDFQAEAQWQEMAISQQQQQQQQQQQSQEGESSGSDLPSSNSNSNKRPTLQDLFRPPLELMYRGPFVSAREEGVSQNKWLLVNIQDGRQFPCQILNRDVWSNQTVKDILKENFIFWQVYHDSFEGSRYVQFYGVNSFPHVAIIDPRTGEQMRSWPTSIDHSSFCDSVIEFLSEHTSPDGSSDSSTMKKLCVKEVEEEDEDIELVEEEPAPTLYDQSEEAQLEAAIKASLKETEKSDPSKAIVDDISRIAATESDLKQIQSVSMCNGNALTDGTVADCDSDPVKVDDYRDYLGANTDKHADLMIRFPDGRRTPIKFPWDSPMKALFLFLAGHGYRMDKYNFVTNFPRRLLHEVPSTQTMADTNLSRETIFVERKPE